MEFDIDRQIDELTGTINQMIGQLKMLQKIKELGMVIVPGSQVTKVETGQEPEDKKE